MASIVYNRFLANLANKIVDWEADDIRVALVQSSYTLTADHNAWSEVSAHEVGAAATAYTQGGEQLTSITVTQDDTNDVAKLDAGDVTWQTSTITGYYAVLYDSTLASNDLICCIDFAEDKSSSDGDFTIQWDVNGIISIGQGSIT